MTLSEMMVQVVLPSLAALSAGGAAGLVYGKRKPGRQRSEPPSAPDVQRAARSAGFAPGDTGQFAALNSIGPMRCDGHGVMTQSQGAILRSLDELKADQRQAREERQASFRSVHAKLDDAAEWRADMGATIQTHGSRIATAEGEIARLRDHPRGGR